MAPRERAALNVAAQPVVWRGVLTCVRIGVRSVFTDDAVEHLRRVVEPVEALAQDKSRGEDIVEIYFAAVARARGEPGPATATGRCAQTHRETRRASPAMLPPRGARSAR